MNGTVLNGIGLTLLVVSLVFYYFGITEPIIAIQVDYIELVRALGGETFQNQTDEQLKALITNFAQTFFGNPSFNYDEFAAPTEQSVLSGVDELYKINNYVPATIILLFSIVLPVLKTIAIFAGLAIYRSGTEQIRRFLAFIHKWTMVDVFAVSVIVFAISRNSFIEASIMPGLIWFFTYFVLSQIALTIMSFRRADEA